MLSGKHELYKDHLSLSSPPPTYGNEPLVVTTQQPFPVGVCVDCAGSHPGVSVCKAVGDCVCMCTSADDSG